jgi:KDO2-lipid IV(A) lauroyltransferase
LVFDEHPLKDLYRRLIWGPYRRALEAAPPGVEIDVNRGLGRVVCRASGGRRATLRAHLADALGPHPNLDRMVKECFETHFSNQYVGFTFQKVTSETWPDFLTIVGRDHLDRALDKGKGVIVAHPHFALPQLPLHVLGVLGYDVHQIGGGKPTVELSPTGEQVARVRAELEARIVATLHDGKGYIRPILRAIQDNKVVFTACDGTGGGDELGRRVVVQMLGRRVTMPVFAPWAGLRTGATVIPMVPWRNRAKGARYVAEFEAPLELTGSAKNDADVQRGAQQLAGRVERWLRQHPGDWHFWDKWTTAEGGLLVGATE